MANLKVKKSEQLYEIIYKMHTLCIQMLIFYCFLIFNVKQQFFNLYNN